MLTLILLVCIWLAMPLGCILVMAFLICRSWARKVGYEITLSKLRKVLRVVAIAVGTVVSVIVVLIVFACVESHFDPARPRGFSQAGLPPNLKVYISEFEGGMEFYDKENTTGTEICEAKPIDETTRTLLAAGAMAIMPDGKELLVARYSTDGWSTHSVNRIERRNAAGEVKWAAEMGQDTVEHLAVSPDAKSFVCIVSSPGKAKQLKWMSFEDKTTTELLSGDFYRVEWSNDPNHVWLIENHEKPKEAVQPPRKALYLNLESRQAEATYDNVDSACAIKDGYLFLHGSYVTLNRTGRQEKVELPFPAERVKSLPDGTGVVFCGDYLDNFISPHRFGYLDCEKKTAFSVMEAICSDDYAASTN